MKFATLFALVAVASAQVAYGDECTETEVCADDLECAWTMDDTTGYCQDCTAEDREWDDGEEFYCMSDMEEESSKGLVASAVALVAAATMMA